MAMARKAQVERKARKVILGAKQLASTQQAQVELISIEWHPYYFAEDFREIRR